MAYIIGIGIGLLICIFIAFMNHILKWIDKVNGKMRTVEFLRERYETLNDVMWNNQGEIRILKEKINANAESHADGFGSTCE